jgi:hypothetical protein
MLNKKILLLIIFLGCTTTKERIQTGVEIFRYNDGKIVLIATGKASQYSINKNNSSMMQTTSREAANLLLENELQKSEYKNLKNKFKITYIEFINNGEYCKITAEYNP